MSDGNASFIFANGRLEIAGSELFVSQQLDFFRDAVLKIMEARPETVLEITDQRAAVAAESSNQFDSAPDREVGNTFPRVLDLVNEKLRVTKKVPGKNNAERTVNCALIYLWGCLNLKDEELVDSKGIRTLCEDQGCLDSGNFAGTLASKKDLIILDGVKGSTSKQCKLTINGRERAEELLSEMDAS